MFNAPSYSGKCLACLALSLWPLAASSCPPADALLEAVRSGVIDSINGLAISAERDTVYATHWVSLGADRAAALVSYSFGPDGWTLDGPIFPDSAFQDYQPRISPDGRRLFFTSIRPPGEGSEAARQNVWSAHWRPDGWSEPRPIERLISESWDGHAALTSGGDLYFASDRPGGLGMVDIYRTRLAGFDTGPIENVAPLNSPHSDQDFHLDPHERFIILARYDDASKDIDLYFSVREDGIWAEALPIAIVNTESWELSPTVDAHSGTLLFKRGDMPGFQSISIDALPEPLVRAINH